MTRAVLPLVLSIGCAAPDTSDMFNALEISVASDGPAAVAAFVDVIQSASDTLHVALPAGDDVALSDALIAAHERGVLVEVLTDYDLSAGPVVSALLAAEVPVRLADGGITYFEFNLGDDVTWPSSDTLMSHAYVVADELRVLAATTVGGNGAGTRVLLDVRGEDLIEDLLSEHNQMFGGIDAVAVTAFDAPAKSILELRWRYGLASDVELELWFGPQERLIKRVIDGVYAARSAVWILTNDLADEGLARALQRKAETGFDVQVLVGPAFGVSNSSGSRTFEDETPDVDKRRVTDEVVPTIVLIDYPDDAEGYRSRAMAMILTHDLYTAPRLYRGQPVITDQFIDGAMWVLSDVSAPSPELLTVDDIYRDYLDRSGAF